MAGQPNFEMFRNVDWAQVEPQNLSPHAGVPPVPSQEHVTSSGVRDWNNTLGHWGATREVPSDVLANTLPQYTLPAEPTSHVTSSGARDWENQREHWGLGK